MTRCRRACTHVQGQTEAAADLFRRAATGADDVLALLKQEPGSLQSPLHPAELHVDALLGHAQTLAASARRDSKKIGRVQQGSTRSVAATVAANCSCAAHQATRAWLCMALGAS